MESMKHKVIALRHRVGYFGYCEIWQEGKYRMLIDKDGRETFRYEVKP